MNMPVCLKVNPLEKIFFTVGLSYGMQFQDRNENVLRYTLIELVTYSHFCLRFCFPVENT